MIGVLGTLFWHLFRRTLLALIFSQAFYFMNTSISLLFDALFVPCALRDLAMWCGGPGRCGGGC